MRLYSSTFGSESPTFGDHPATVTAEPSRRASEREPVNREGICVFDVDKGLGVGGDQPSGAETFGVTFGGVDGTKSDDEVAFKNVGQHRLCSWVVMVVVRASKPINKTRPTSTFRRHVMVAFKN